MEKINWIDFKIKYSLFINNNFLSNLIKTKSLKFNLLVNKLNIIFKSIKKKYY